MHTKHMPSPSFLTALVLGTCALPCHGSERQLLRVGGLIAGVTLQKTFLRCLKGLAWLINPSLHLGQAWR